MIEEWIIHEVSGIQFSNLLMLMVIGEGCSTSSSSSIFFLFRCSSDGNHSKRDAEQQQWPPPPLIKSWKKQLQHRPNEDEAEEEPRHRQLWNSNLFHGITIKKRNSNLLGIYSMAISTMTMNYAVPKNSILEYLHPMLHVITCS